jgi:hypothetical protein
MFNSLQVLVVFAVMILSTVNTFARDFRVDYIPNGKVNKCLNCHTQVDPKDGKSLTPFGKIVESNYLDDNGDVIWNAALAALDSDGDGFSNGTELQDPNGTWLHGNSDPGTPANTSNPGDKASIPPGTFVTDESTPFNVLYNVYPNPVSSSNCNIQLNLLYPATVTMSIMDIQGNIVRNLCDSKFIIGNYVQMWDRTDNRSNNVLSGTYFLTVTLNNTYTRLLEKIVITN